VETVLALGFDLFFKPKLNAAAEKLGIRLVYAPPADRASVTRIVADVSAPGVEEQLRAWHGVPILACYPHVETHRAEAVRALGGVAVTRGRFAEHIEDALAGKLA
jgi:hypothetical protein